MILSHESYERMRAEGGGEIVACPERAYRTVPAPKQMHWFTAIYPTSSREVSVRCSGATWPLNAIGLVTLTGVTAAGARHPLCYRTSCTGSGRLRCRPRGGDGRFSHRASVRASGLRSEALRSAQPHFVVSLAGVTCLPGALESEHRIGAQLPAGASAHRALSGVAWQSNRAGGSVGVLFHCLSSWSGLSVSRTASSSTSRSAYPKALMVERVIGKRGGASAVEATAFFRRPLARSLGSTPSRPPIARVGSPPAREFRPRRSRSRGRFTRSIPSCDGVRKLADSFARFIRRCASGHSLAKHP